MKKWEKIKGVDGYRIPCLVGFSYDGAELIIQVKLGNQIKTIKCEGVLSFKMIEEGSAFHTLEEQNIDGNTWIFKTDSSTLIDWFNYESESIHSNQLASYIIVTQDQFFEFITHTELQIS